MTNIKERSVKRLIGKKVKITSDNENYEKFLGETLIITHAAIGGIGYDDSVYPQALCDFEIKGSNESFPFALYEYEFRIL